MMFVRWLLAAPLLLAGFVGVPLAYLVASTWLFRRTWSLRAEFDLRTEVVAKIGTLTGPAWPVLLAVVLFACCWRMTTAWPRIALVATVPLAFTGIFNTDLRLAAAIATPVVAYALAWLAVQVVTRPRTPDVQRSPVEIAIKLRTGARLRLQSRRLLLDKLPQPIDSRATVARLAIPYDRIKHVEAGTYLGQSTHYPLANSSSLEIDPGTAVRVVGGGQEWLLPTDDDVAELIIQRARARQRPDPRPALDNAYWKFAKSMWEMADSPTVQPVKQKLSHGIHHLRLIAGVLCSAMAVFAAYRIFTDGFGYLIGVGFFGVTAWHALRTWRSIGAGLKLAEENPRPPTTPDADPRLVPIAGWSTAVHPIGG